MTRSENSFDNACLIAEARRILLQRISDLLGGRRVRWAEGVVGDYDERERTIEVFDAKAHEQRDLFRRLRVIRKDLEAHAGGPVIVIFHARPMPATKTSP